MTDVDSTVQIESDIMPAPTAQFTGGSDRPSRPLSEISNNSDHRRSVSAPIKDKAEPTKSRPVSEIKETQKKDQAALNIQTLTVNLVEYARQQAHDIPRAASAPPPPSPTTKPVVREKTPEPVVVKPPALPAERVSEPVDRGISELYTSKRASLRPSPLAGDSNASPRSSSEVGPLPMKPFTKAKPKWLRRASVTPAGRSKSKSPVGDVEPEDSTMTASASLPPALPPRKGKNGLALVESDSKSSGEMLPPKLPPELPPRDNSNFRNRLAGWGGVSRSESSSSIASQASARQRVLGHAGSAVQKGWAGLRARGVAGSISGMSSLAQQATRRAGMEPSSSWSSGLVRKASRERFRNSEADSSVPVGDGPVFQPGVVRRPAGDQTGRVFGREIIDAGRAWGVTEMTELDDYETRRRGCLPAIVVRTVEYLNIWGPKEEGIFRISGRSSHIARLRREFDSGADLDLRDCHPGDLDPHAVSGVFKSYLRELPSPILTQALTARFDAAVQQRPIGKGQSEDLPSLLSTLPSAHWFLLADIVKLLVLIPQHSATNRMTLNALMLSLGPSLNISGPVLTELLANHKQLFANPPSISGLETAAAVDFGDLEIVPTVPVNLSPKSTLSRSAPKIPKKPSLTRLFPSNSGSIPKVSTVDPIPPRIDLALDGSSSPLASFESSSKPATPAQTLHETSESVPPVGPPPSTPTPIADRFSATGSTFPSLRKSNEAPTPPDTSPANPATVIRRGAPVFFQSKAAHERTLSSSTIPAATKRKDDSSSIASASQAEGSKSPSEGSEAINDISAID